MPAAGYRIRGERGSLVLGGDGRCGAEFWRAVNATRDLRYLVIEASFPDRLATLARASKHLNVGQFALELAHLQRDTEVYTTHMKPGLDREIHRELRGIRSPLAIRGLAPGHVFEI